MTSRDFCFWLQGFFELVMAPGNAEPNLTRLLAGLSAAQVEMIRRHLALVFKHEIDPSMHPKVELDAIHNSPSGGAIPAGLRPRC